MSSVRVVPETKLMSGEQLAADDACHTVRRYGLGHLLATGFLRFRYGDGSGMPGPSGCSWRSPPSR